VKAQRLRLSNDADVVGLIGNDMSDPTAARLDIAVVPGNHMDVEMKDCLPGGVADVHAEVVPVGLVDLLDGDPRVVDGGHQLSALLVGGLEP
jgi:hypothetical protein